MIPLTDLWLALVAFGASVVNGAVGYGFSSTITPIALLWYSNKVLNPALVVIEVGVNLTLLVRERKFLRGTWGRARPIVSTLFPGIVLGTIGLTYLAVNDVKLIVYTVLFPLVALQLYGFSRPLRNERRGGATIGVGIGFLYALTTISGPPLALFLRNQGLSKDEFRATIAQIRVAESTLTIGTYFVFSQFFGAPLLTLPFLELLPYLLVPAIVGIPLGALLLSKVSPEFFRRFVMAVDGVFISYGLSVVLVALHWVRMEVSQLLLSGFLAGTAVLAYLSLRRIPLRSDATVTTDPPQRADPPQVLRFDRPARDDPPPGASVTEPRHPGTGPGEGIDPSVGTGGRASSRG